ncbi:MAG TPA: hypothetical protein VFK40_13865 [Nitrososphaeraceae archaeon]|jgi:hypothetical protein|nr:hypothetical protein [Nitrososphaeraceae archaeon]
MKTTIFFNAMIIMLLGIGITVGGLTGSALAQTDNQTNAEQGKNNTDSGSNIMDKIGDVAKEKLKEGIQEIIGGSNNK